jgi:hypothetical protein
VTEDELVDSLLDEQSKLVSEDEVEKRLAAQGVITIPSGVPVAAAARPQPIPVTGKPVSETIIEERGQTSLIQLQSNLTG